MMHIDKDKKNSKDKQHGSFLDIRCLKEIVLNCDFYYFIIDSWFWLSSCCIKRLSNWLCFYEVCQPFLFSSQIYKKIGFVRWWRAPEIYINWERYDEKLDLWSVGCIMAELIRLRPVFPGSDHIDQLNKIFAVIGTPNLATLHEICTPGM